MQLFVYCYQRMKIVDYSQMQLFVYCFRKMQLVGLILKKMIVDSERSWILNYFGYFQKSSSMILPTLKTFGYY